jgi:hypothetical protein
MPTRERRRGFPLSKRRFSILYLVSSSKRSLIYVGTEMMNQKITAIFNGEAFYPTETFNLKPNTKVKLTIETQLIDEEQLQIMADDLDILGEIATINQEFMVSEMDGL